MQLATQTQSFNVMVEVKSVILFFVVWKHIFAVLIFERVITSPILVAVTASIELRDV
jgi:hypothetical protein